MSDVGSLVRQRPFDPGPADPPRFEPVDGHHQFSGGAVHPDLRREGLVARTVPADQPRVNPQRPFGAAAGEIVAVDTEGHIDVLLCPQRGVVVLPAAVEYLEGGLHQPGMHRFRAGFHSVGQHCPAQGLVVTAPDGVDPVEGVAGIEPGDPHVAVELVAGQLLGAPGANRIEIRFREWRVRLGRCAFQHGAEQGGPRGTGGRRRGFLRCDQGHVPVPTGGPQYQLCAAAAVIGDGERIQEQRVAQRVRAVDMVGTRREHHRDM